MARGAGVDFNLAAFGARCKAPVASAAGCGRGGRGGSHGVVVVTAVVLALLGASAVVDGALSLSLSLSVSDGQKCKSLLIKLARNRNVNRFLSNSLAKA